jgi:hypothetical protein
VITERTLQTFGRLIGSNHLYWQTALSTPSSRVVVSPNVDTLYSIAVLDLRSGPVTLTVPRIADRYYVFQFLDGWTNSFAYVGTRATAARPGTWMITPPRWHGTIPTGDTQIVAPTPQVFLLGRFFVKDAADIANVTPLHETVTLRSLSSTPPPALGAPPGPPTGVAKQDASFYDELGDALAINPPASDADRAALQRFAALGIGPGKHPFANGTTAARTVLSRGVTQGQGNVTTAAATQSHVVNGWSTRLDVGTYTDPLVRAVVARFGWGANIPAEAVYSSSNTDGSGQAYRGRRNYVMHFAAGALPPVQAFWSLTLYGPDNFLVENPLHRYAISDRNPGIVRNPDGSLDIYIGNVAPAGHTANWLPAPPGHFRLTVRMYLPDRQVLDGEYHVPPVQVRP